MQELLDIRSGRHEAREAARFWHMTLPDFDALPDLVRAEKIAHMRLENLFEAHVSHARRIVDERHAKN